MSVTWGKCRKNCNILGLIIETSKLDEMGGQLLLLQLQGEYESPVDSVAFQVLHCIVNKLLGDGTDAMALKSKVTLGKF